MNEMDLDCDFIILNRIPTLYSAQRFQTEIMRQNLNGLLLSPEDLQNTESQIETKILYRQGEFNFWQTQAFLEASDLMIVNHPRSFMQARDKWQTYLTWQLNGIPMPETILIPDLAPEAYLSENFPSTIVFNKAFAYFNNPFILKKRCSSQGRGVYLINSHSDLHSILKEDEKDFHGAHPIEHQYFQNDFLRRWVLQECVTESMGRDVRNFHVNGLDYTMERENLESFRSNIHQGGKPTKTVLSAQEKQFCERIHFISGLDYSGIDFFRTSKGPLYIEINPSPGFEGIEALYSCNIAFELILLLKS